MTLYLPELNRHDVWFPKPSLALQEPDGLLAFGGDLSAERLIAAYQNGIFPWFSHNEPILWWSPSMRALFIPHHYRPARSLLKFQKKHRYRVSINQATKQVIALCASTRPASETWITREMQQAYIELAHLGHCHSVEVWSGSELIGGLYGVAVGQVFCGESMFSLQTNASKIALWYFSRHFYKNNGRLIDCQIMNPHLASLGAVERPRKEFQSNLKLLQAKSLNSDCYQPQWLVDPDDLGPANHREQR